MKKFFKSGSSAAFTVAIGFVSGCVMPSSGKVSALLSTSSQTQGQGQTDTTYQTVPANSAFSLNSALSTASMSLGAAADHMYTLTTGAYSGSIQLTVENDEIKAVDTKNQVAFTVTPSVIAISPNTSYTFTVHVSTTTLAPDFNLHYHVVARDAAGSIRKETQMEMPFNVLANYDITITPSANKALNAMVWSTDLADPTTGINKKQTLNFAAHTGGITLTFYNNDNTDHIIHGGAPITHQNTATYIRAAGPSPAAAVAGRTYITSYVTKITSQTTPLIGTYYSHDMESGSKAGTVNFNVAPVVVTTTGTTDPTATFTKVNVVIQASCISCHSTANPQGGVNLSSYAGVLNTLIPGASASSSFYTTVLANLMPIGSQLSQTNKDLFKNWIDNGALNN
jgi:hypothetical protein